jgi:hypothetical protein
MELSKRQIGDVGETMVQSALQKKGHTVSVPQSENNAYDLVAEKDGEFEPVQVKTTRRETPSGGYEVDLRDIKYNLTETTVGTNKSDEYALLAVVTCRNIYFIPAEEVEGYSTITVSPTNDWGKFLEGQANW